MVSTDEQVFVIGAGIGGLCSALSLAPTGRRVVRIPLPRAFEPRRVGVIWTRSTIRIRLVKAFLEEAQAASASPKAVPSARKSSVP